MIIELFGPSGAGKTTLSSELVAALQDAGHDVQLVASSRPAEGRSASGDHRGSRLGYGATLAAPLSRAAKLAGAMPAMLSSRPEDEVGLRLLEILPPTTLVSKLRHRRYLSLLCRAWKDAQASDRVFVFDQGFILALSSLLLTARSADPASIEEGLDIIPEPDLLVCLDAPRNVLDRRLQARLARQGTLERLFELDRAASLRHREIVWTLARILEDRRRPMIRVRCLDPRGLKSAVRQIVLESAAKLGRGAYPAGHASCRRFDPEVGLCGRASSVTDIRSRRVAGSGARAGT
jgi:thymidylate kinase